MFKKLEKAIKKFKNYLKTNILMTTFIVSSLINGCLVRFFTVENYFAIKPILADLVVLLIITAFGYFFKPKHQFKYFLGWSILFTLICIVNAVYYSNYLSFASLSLLKTAGELGGYADAVIKNILEIKQLIYLWQIFALCFVHIQLKKKRYYYTNTGKPASAFDYFKYKVKGFFTNVIILILSIILAILS